MPIEKINGVNLFIEEFGAGEPLVLVHGSWVDHMGWLFIVPTLAQRFRVIVYDRRGHSQSERPPAQGSVREDVADLAAIIERAGAPVHVLGNSFGGSISLRLAAQRPELFRTLMVHESPLFGLLRDDPATRSTAEALDAGMAPIVTELEAGNMEAGARRFVEMVLGPDAWDMLPDVGKQTMINNGPTFLDEARDPETLMMDLTPLSRLSVPVLVSDGSESPPFFAPVLEKLAAVLPNATRKTFVGAGHVPHVTHPQEYARAVIEFAGGSSANR